MRNVKDAIIRLSMGEASSEDKKLVDGLDEKTFSDLYENMKSGTIDNLFSLEDFYEEDKDDKEETPVVDEPEEVTDKSPCENIDKVKVFARNRAIAKAVIMNNRNKKRVL